MVAVFNALEAESSAFLSFDILLSLLSSPAHHSHPDLYHHLNPCRQSTTHHPSSRPSRNVSFRSVFFRLTSSVLRPLTRSPPSHQRRPCRPASPRVKTKLSDRVRTLSIGSFRRVLEIFRVIACPSHRERPQLSTPTGHPPIHPANPEPTNKPTDEIKPERQK